MNLNYYHYSLFNKGSCYSGIYESYPKVGVGISYIEALKQIAKKLNKVFPEKSEIEITEDMSAINVTSFTFLYEINDDDIAPQKVKKK